jgi:hypothetical protein
MRMRHLGDRSTGLNLVSAGLRSALPKVASGTLVRPAEATIVWRLQGAYTNRRSEKVRFRMTFKSLIGSGGPLHESPNIVRLSLAA